ncbi:lipid A-modifier LpxR family protein [Actibacterium sp. MT2.3-13A]|uniref:lipid A-modifier LpxR family protein n=1 Tax=Actibacterium sp. MT2.3-13A TaxID=2828332 RepID=UPI001BAC47DA|nr:lipid A-modifier LpxR family protein [Actibacterium sp. MT2.3-13A]
MIRTLCAALVAALMIAPPAAAENRRTLGYGRVFSNDALGDGEDRWRSGSYALSVVTGPGWQGALPAVPGVIREYRLRSELLAPESLTAPVPGDRRYVGALSFGMHSHFRRGGTDFSLGGDIVLTGPQTGLSAFQRAVHDWANAAAPAAAKGQIGNHVYPTLLAQAAHPLQLSAQVQARPFVEAQAGVETLLRVGGDLIVGRIGQTNLKLRDVATGHLYHATRSDGAGASLVLGGDMALVADSFYLPSSDGYALSDSRTRLRAGVHWEGERGGLFYGLTWHGEEFRGQREGQVSGTLRLRLSF